MEAGFKKDKTKKTKSKKQQKIRIEIIICQYCYYVGGFHYNFDFAYKIFYISPINFIILIKFFLAIELRLWTIIYVLQFHKII